MVTFHITLEIDAELFTCTVNSWGGGEGERRGREGGVDGWMDGQTDKKMKER